MFTQVVRVLRRIFDTDYNPDPEINSWLERSQKQENDVAEVIVAVPAVAEVRRRFGVPATRTGIQPVYLEITNRQNVPLRLFVAGIDPHYFTPLEAAGINHFSVIRRLSTWGIGAWYFLPLLFLLPWKLLSARRANLRMDECFQDLAFPLRPIPAGGTSRGFIYTTLDEGSKSVRVRLHRMRSVSSEERAASLEASAEKLRAGTPDKDTAEFIFSIPVGGIAADYLLKDFSELCPAAEIIPCTLPDFIGRLKKMPEATTNAKGTGHGDPVNLVLIGQLDVLLSVFAGRWDQSETITLSSCWRTVKAFLLGAEYRYSPVSPLYLFNRSQDIALQRIRNSINERLHLRLWLTPLQFDQESVWVGQISRDIGVRFTTKVWNLTTHRIDPDVDEARDYVLEDLLRAEHVDAAGYVDGGMYCTPENPGRNLTGDPWFTDGKRVVVRLSRDRTSPGFIAWE